MKQTYTRRTFSLMEKVLDEPLLLGSGSTCKLLRTTSASLLELKGTSSVLKNMLRIYPFWYRLKSSNIRNICKYGTKMYTNLTMCIWINLKCTSISTKYVYHELLLSRNKLLWYI